MRDDVQALAAELALQCGKKLDLLQKLLLSETDKLHYLNSGNLDRVIALTRDDGALIDAINLVDYDIARAEDELCRILGIGRTGLYGTLGRENDARDLVGLRDRIRRCMEELTGLRNKLAAKLEADARGVRESILALSRIDSLKLPDPDGTGR